MKRTLKTQESLNGQIKCQNFEILRFGQVHGSQPEKTVATVRFRNPNFALDQEVDIPLSAIRGQKLKEYIPEAFFLEDVPPERQYKEIANRLNKALGHSIAYRPLQRFWLRFLHLIHIISWGPIPKNIFIRAIKCFCDMVIESIFWASTLSIIWKVSLVKN